MNIITPESVKNLYDTLSYKFINLFYGGRGGGKSESIGGQYATYKVIKNLINYKKTGKLYKVCLMRAYQTDIHDSIWSVFMKWYIELSNNNPLFSYLRLLDQEIKLNADDESKHQSILYTKGFRSSSKSKTAGLKGLDDTNCYIIEEAEELTEEEFDQLVKTAIRVKDCQIILMFNTPSNYKHWLIRRFFNLVDSGIEGYFKLQAKDDTYNTACLTFSDNAFLLKEAEEYYLSYKDPNSINYNLVKFYVEILGYVRIANENRIFNNFRAISNKEYNEIEVEELLGLDFGFSNDPNALIGFKKHNNKIYLKEYLYKGKMTNRQIANEIKNLELNQKLIVADSSEPKSIQELTEEGLNIKPCRKGKDSVNYSINKLQDYELLYTSDSMNLESEFINYTWRLDGNKNITDVPIDAFNHLMDALRYVAMESIDSKDIVQESSNYISTDEDIYNNVVTTSTVY